MRVLVIEDERRLAALLVQVLTEEGWTATAAHDGASGLDALRTGGVDVVVLDWMLPDLAGPTVLQALRAEGHAVPVLMLTARTALEDRVTALDVGADDHLAKPFEVAELLARLRALHRRANPTVVAAHRAGDLVVDPQTRRVFRGPTEVMLTAREFDILALLMDEAGHAVSRYRILEEVWDGDTDISSNVIDVHMGRLRGKIDGPFGRNAIQTLRGAGYRLDPAGG
ncbi:response regulator transcription factor [Quadrisphaera sp. INWT6]|uniref:response regulator transcription factor n=1 Tax=Quadrisphaera sp. INWT6 TaxID=2596917 RepID=UPI0018920824|nr:response regulator transcription factor [Quadrisphaera sp. INWT6]MBF5083067.1 response regulator transcription factor [Quadrisphaera sp. INWT6]